jgi:RNA polymerase sigma factor (sigma-70 family)
VEAFRRSGEELESSGQELAHPPSTRNPEKKRTLARFVEANMSLVVEAARLLRGRGVPFSDLVQEGSLALIGAFGQVGSSSDLEFKKIAIFAIRERLRDVVEANEESETKSRGLLENVRAPDPAALGLEAERIETTHALLAMLAEDQERVLKLRFGIETSQPSTLEAVAHSLGMQRGRVSGLESRALTTLRRAVHRLRWTFPR